MSGTPLQPFSPSSSLFQIVSDEVPASTFIIGTFYAVFVFWSLYTLVAIYHWIKYSHASLIAIPAIALHLLVSVALIAYALSGAFIEH